MWRDRTNLFISYRQSYSHHPTRRPGQSAAAGAFLSDGGSLSEERRGLMSGADFNDDGDAVIEMDLLPPRWLDVQDDVTEHLADIAKSTRRLDQLHQKHVLPGFDDEAVKRREERDIEQLTQAITRHFQSCQTAIKKIDRMVAEAKQSGNITKSEEAMAHNLKISLAARVSDASANFRKKQAAYLKKLRTLGGLTSPAPLSRSATPTLNPYSDPSMQESDADRALSQSTMMQTQQRRQTHTLNDSLIAQREREIESIAQGVIELANIFQELQSMVIDQGTMLDRIDYNVERMTTEVKGADKELKVATNYQRRTVKRKIILLLLLLVAGMVILLSLKIGTRKSGDSNSGPAPATPADPPAAPLSDVPPDSERIREIRGATSPRTRKDWHRRKRRLWARSQILVDC
ncbi:t-SNARE [Lineolata rhizophorae]|uniref:t-SNARE n=1 Tax=Lineolata rhizophorae TaxID=578093 RepID=A0A6A6NYU0_9PEZI|nr:t-SNARE [Lineolata rhizophorae]